MADRELDVTAWRGSAEGLGGDTDTWIAQITDAIDLSLDQGIITWLTDHGHRMAAIVPVDGGRKDPTLETRLTALAVLWELQADRMIDGSWIDCLLGCAEELRAELER